MADASNPEVDFSAEGVRSFIAKHGGKVSNVAIVGHFMTYLRHPDKEVREDNRKKFKEFMNEVAMVKKDEKDDKVVVLKRKQKDINYRDFVELPKLVVFQDKDPSKTSADTAESEPVPPVRRPKHARRSVDSEDAELVAVVTGPPVDIEPTEYTGPKEQDDVISTKEGERIIDQKRQIQSVRSFAGIFDQEVQSQKEEVERLKSPIKTAPKTSLIESSSEPETFSQTNRPEEGLKEDEPAPLISTGLQSSVTMQSISSEASTSCSTDTVAHWHQLDPLEHQWMMESAKANLAALSNLLKQDINLAGKKDFVTTALHWGAKHGKKEMIRLVADRGADINCRSQGGYTPLHIAAMHDKESVMQFLVQDYHADVNVRDFSGRKARHYLKTGASSYMQQMMKGTPPTTSPPRVKLMALAETSPEKYSHHHHHHHQSMFTSFRDTIRNSFRIWGSADNLDEPDNSKPQLSPRNRKSGIEYLMPPSAAPKLRRHTESTAPSMPRSDMRKSESDPNIMESTESMFV